MDNAKYACSLRMPDRSGYTFFGIELVEGKILTCDVGSLDFWQSFPAMELTMGKLGYKKIEDYELPQAMMDAYLNSGKDISQSRFYVKKGA